VKIVKEEKGRKEIGEGRKERGTIKERTDAFVLSEDQKIKGPLWEKEFRL